ncbi:hypothetical protein P7K49_018704 [Saguinus oedipus]|uniref:L-asparaginase N-terminal domain-containing protein n=1 Tax=Saguinus oedipus TaxID=9490 RepID=A0ABQ9V658_SAGOE|nr:hypothetical protein P7K49_018704 [Saguinus oedipus]
MLMPGTGLAATLRTLPMFHDEEHAQALGLPEDTCPASPTLYTVLECQPLFHSSDMTIAEWVPIAQTIELLCSSQAYNAWSFNGPPGGPGLGVVLEDVPVWPASLLPFRVLPTCPDNLQDNLLAPGHGGDLTLQGVLFLPLCPCLTCALGCKAHVPPQPPAAIERCSHPWGMRRGPTEGPILLCSEGSPSVVDAPEWHRSLRARESVVGAPGPHTRGSPSREGLPGQGAMGASPSAPPPLGPLPLLHPPHTHSPRGRPAELTLLQRHCEQYHGFVIIHGTDTLAFAGSVLSFMLENLQNTIVLTGTQVTQGAQGS